MRVLARKFRFKALDGLVEIVFTEVRHTEEKIHPGVSWVVSKDLLKVCNRFGKFHLCLFQDAQAFQNLWIPGGKLKGLQIYTLCRSIITLHFQRVSLVKLRSEERRVGKECTFGWAWEVENAQQELV